MQVVWKPNTFWFIYILLYLGLLCENDWFLGDDW